MNPSDSRRGRTAVMCSRPALAPPLPPRRVSQVPRLISPHAPSPTTPEGPTAAFARCFTAGGGLHLSLAGWPPSLGVTRPNRVRLRYGSRGRSAGLRLTDHSALRPLRFLLNEQLTGQPPFRSQDQPGFAWRTNDTDEGVSQSGEAAGWRWVHHPKSGEGSPPQHWGGAGGGAKERAAPLTPQPPPRMREGGFSSLCRFAGASRLPISGDAPPALVHLSFVLLDDFGVGQRVPAQSRRDKRK
jgi:hypothetical protein